MKKEEKRRQSGSRENVMRSFALPDCKEYVDDDRCCADPQPEWSFAVREHHGWIVYSKMDVPVHVENQNQEASDGSVSKR